MGTLQYRGRPARHQTGRMTRGWTPLALVYLVLSIAGLVGTAICNVLAVLQHRNFFGDWFAGGPAISSLTTDLLVAAVAGSILIIIEARRLGMRRSWLYVVGSALTAFAFTFPLFLAMRERKLAAARGRSSDRTPPPGPPAP